MTIPATDPSEERAARSNERSTRQRRAIRAIFEAAERPLSVEEVLAAARRGRHAVSLSTVYRFVRSLVADASLAAIEVPGLGAYYERPGKAHHHHLSCVRCRRVYELDACVGIDAIALPAGFRAVSHELTIVGVCAGCNVRAAPRPRA